MSVNRLASIEFKPIESERRVQKVYQALHDAIFSGKLEPNAPLVELKLARDLAVSQSTVREALVELEHKGLVERTPHRGTRVKNLTKEELAERIRVRTALETLACTLAAEEFTEQDYDALEKLADQIIRQDYLADEAFHHYIWKRSGNSTLQALLEQISSSLFGFVSILRDKAFQNPKARVESHRAFIAALRSKNRKTIERAVREHLESAYSMFLESPYPDFEAVYRATKQAPA